MPKKGKKEAKHKACAPFNPPYIQAWRERNGFALTPKRKEEDSNDEAISEEQEEESAD